MNGQSGFSLIEALVAGIISVIIPGTVIVLLGVNNSEMAYNSTRSRLSQISTAVSEDIRRTAYRADRVFEGAIVTSVFCPPAPAVIGNDAFASSFDSVSFCGANNLLIKSYRIVRISDNLGRLEERTGFGAWQPFVVGSDTARIDLNVGPFQPKSPGIFGVGLDAQFLFYNFHFNMNVGGVAATLPMQTESFVCRNSVSRSW